MFLVDTNVLSAGAPTREAHMPELAAWLEANSIRLFISVITVAEVEEGIAKARRTGAARKADRLSEWLETLLHLYRPRILKLDVAVARVLGSLADRAHAAGQAPGLADLAIAATARCHGHTVLTRNPRHFGPLDVPAHDPFATLP